MHQTASTDAHTGAGQFLSFTLGADDYALDILRVQEIRGWENVRALPDSPDYVKGVLDLRGTIVPIFDLRVRFGDPSPAYSATTVVIVVSVQLGDGRQNLVGAVVDGVSDVLDITSAERRAPPILGARTSQCYLAGMVTLPRGMVILLDIDKLFDQHELSEICDRAGT